MSVEDGSSDWVWKISPDKIPKMHRGRQLAVPIQKIIDDGVDCETSEVLEGQVHPNNPGLDHGDLCHLGLDN